ncbi:MAG: TolC family protein [Deltaproteobacteria bacterium]|nr:TolC family protein [Deltaproteobacteria bacterium]
MAPFTKLITVVFCVLQLAPQVLFAEPKSAGATLEQYKGYAISKSPAAKQIDAKAAAKLAEALQAELGLNPELSSEFRSSSKDEEDTEVEVSLSKPLRLGQSSLRKEISNLLNQSARQEQKADLLQLSQNVTGAYARLWGTNEKVEILKNAKPRLERSAVMVAEATSKGLLSGGEQAFFEAQAALIEAAMLEAIAEKAEARAELIRTSGLRWENEALLRPEFMPLSSCEEIKHIAKESEISPLKRSKLLAEAAERQLRLARKESYPLIEPRLVYEHADNGSDRFGAGISFPLPLFNRNQAEVKRREAELNSIQASNQYTASSSFDLEIDALCQAVQSLEKRSQILSSVVAAKLRQAVKLQEQQFGRGQGSPAQVWQSQRELLNAELAAIDSWQKAVGTRLMLWAVAGEEI